MVFACTKTPRRLPDARAAALGPPQSEEVRLRALILFRGGRFLVVCGFQRRKARWRKASEMEKVLARSSA
jgi:hypothetical protein